MIPDHRLGPGVRPVWAYGNIERTVTAVPDPVTSGLYHVTVTSTGSFAAFANPIDGSTWTGGGGSVKGTIEYDVSSLNSPTTSGLPSQVDDGSHSAAMALRLFSAPGSNAFVSGGGAYQFSYSPVPVPAIYPPLGPSISVGQGPNGLAYEQNG